MLQSRPGPDAETTDLLTLLLHDDRVSGPVGDGEANAVVLHDPDDLETTLLRKERLQKNMWDIVAIDFFLPKNWDSRDPPPPV